MFRRFALIFVAFSFLTFAAPPQASASSPVARATIVQSGLVIPWDVAFTPDGTMFVTERPGRIRVYASGQADAALLRTVTVPDVRSEHESGLLGIAVDTNFASHPYIYVCASRDRDRPEGEPRWQNEVIRYQVTAQKNLINPTVLLTGMRAHTQHNGCALLMDQQRKLWLTMGDAGVLASSQDPNSLNGKVLRINANGTIPDDNPTLPGAAAKTAAYAMGLRNPQGIGFRPGTSQVYASEHGPNTDDEINLLEPGANYGWPCYTGFERPFRPNEHGCDGRPATEFDPPAWTSGSFTIATSGMTFLNSPIWGSWDGSAVVSQLKEADIRRFVPQDGGTKMVETDLLFDGVFGRLRAAVIAPDGTLYTTTSNGSNDRVIRIEPGEVIVDRMSGPDRYATAADVSKKTFGAGVPMVYVATGENYPDALTGGAAASRNRVPLLLVRQNSIPASTAAELDRLAPQRIYVLGSSGVVSSAVETQLKSYTNGPVQRLSGANRFATAAEISRNTFSPSVPAVYIATGFNYPDALAGVPAAGFRGGPILLVRENSIPTETATELSRLAPQRIFVLGSSGVISNAVQDQLRGFTNGPVQRHAGPNRYATAVAISQGTFQQGAKRVFIATGLNYPDGLAGGPAATFAGGPLLLVPGTSLPTVVRNELLRLGPERVTLLGGSSVVSDGVLAEIDALLNP